MNDTRNESGSGTTEPPLFNQRIWRTIGTVAIAGAALMAWYGASEVTRNVPKPFFIAYWAGFALLLVIALYMALLDLRYIRLQFLVGRREVFRSTVGDEDFRRALIAAQQANEKENPTPSSAPPDHHNQL